MKTAKPSLENLIESEDLGFEILHPGGLELTHELGTLCGVGIGTHLLDVASGTGESACYLAETLGAQVTGLDGSAHMVERAQKKAQQRGLPVEFKQGDAHQLPFGDNTFDIVISECTICILDKEKALREMVRVVKPGGRVGFHDMCWKGDTPERMRRRLEEIEGESPETLDGWKTLCEMVGLVDMEAVDRSSLIPGWMKETTEKLTLGSLLRMIGKVYRRWGIGGLLTLWESERIFESRHTGYAMLVGRKPSGV